MKEGAPLKKNQFIKKHRDDWQQLETWIAKLEKGKAKLTSKEIESFYQQYQVVAQHLSYSQTYFKNEDVTAYLNNLIAKAHNLLYKDQMTSMKQLRYFFSMKFVQLITEQWKFIIVALILFTLGGIGGFIAVLTDPFHLYSVVPPEIAYGLIDPEDIGEMNPFWDPAVFSALIMTNNMKVAILAFAGGITFGVLTVYVLLLNGVILGAIAAVFWNAGKSYEFWAYIIPHGIIELTAIFIAGGAGLLMGYKLLVPGHVKRTYELKIQATRSVQLLFGTIPLFVITGIIEGYITPSTSLSFEMKYIVALITVLSLIVYILFGHLRLQKRKMKDNGTKSLPLLS